MLHIRPEVLVQLEYLEIRGYLCQIRSPDDRYAALEPTMQIFRDLRSVKCLKVIDE